MSEFKKIREEARDDLQTIIHQQHFLLSAVHNNDTMLSNLSSLLEKQDCIIKQTGPFIENYFLIITSDNRKLESVIEQNFPNTDWTLFAISHQQYDDLLMSADLKKDQNFVKAKVTVGNQQNEIIDNLEKFFISKIPKHPPIKKSNYLLLDLPSSEADILSQIPSLNLNYNISWLSSEKHEILLSEPDCDFIGVKFYNLKRAHDCIVSIHNGMFNFNKFASAQINVSCRGPYKNSTADPYILIRVAKRYTALVYAIMRDYPVKSWSLISANDYLDNNALVIDDIFPDKFVTKAKITYSGEKSENEMIQSLNDILKIDIQTKITVKSDSLVLDTSDPFEIYSQILLIDPGYNVSLLSLEEYNDLLDEEEFNCLCVSFYDSKRVQSFLLYMKNACAIKYNLNLSQLSWRGPFTDVSTQKPFLLIKVIEKYTSLVYATLCNFWGKNLFFASIENYYDDSNVIPDGDHSKCVIFSKILFNGKNHVEMIAKLRQHLISTFKNLKNITTFNDDDSSYLFIDSSLTDHYVNDTFWEIMQLNSGYKMSLLSVEDYYGKINKSILSQ